MLTPVLNSPSSLINFNECINSLHTSLLNHLESLPKTNSSLEQIFNFIPIIFQYLHKNLQSQEKYLNEYNHLSINIEKFISICSQYLHDRYNHENELFYLKTKLSQILGQIGYTKECLQKYYLIIYSLEYETERLKILLSNSQLIQINQRKVQIFHETQKIKLDRLIKENEKLKKLINKQNDSIQIIQTHIDMNINELNTLKSILFNIQLEQKDVHQQWSQIKIQNLYLKTMNEKGKSLENEYNDRSKTAKIQHDHAEKQLNALKNISNQTNKKLLSIQTNQNHIKQKIENIKNKITTEQTCSLNYRNQIQTLRNQTNKLEITKHSLHHTLKSEEHINSTLERKHLILQNHQSKLKNHIRILNNQLTNIIQQNQLNKRTISINLIHLENQQNQIFKLTNTLKKLIHLNNNLERTLKENHSIQINEQKKYHSIKQILLEKQKQFNTQKKHFHRLLINENHLKIHTINNCLEIFRLNQILHYSNNKEKYLKLILQRKKSKMIKHEKKRALLNHQNHNRKNQINCLNKKNEFIQNELENKIDHFQTSNLKISKQKHEQNFLLNQKQLKIYSYQKNLRNFNQISDQFDQFENFFQYEIHFILEKNHENEQLKYFNQNLKHKIINLMSKNQRQYNEYLLLNEKIHFYTQINHQYNQEKQDYCIQINYYSYQILDLQKDNDRLLNNLRNLQKKTKEIISFHQDNLLKKEKLCQINQILFHQPIIIRDSPMHIHTLKSLDNYTIFVNRLMEIIHQCIQWREKLFSINQHYFEKVEQINQQMKILSTQNEMNLRYKINLKIKQYKALKAEEHLHI